MRRPESPTSPLADYLGDLRAEIDAALERVTESLGGPAPLVDGIRYALLGGGKRLRPCVTLAVADQVAAARGLELAPVRRLALPFACAVEMVHSYSLVHDDLPAMDDDALRRGRPTAHVVFGEGLAILIGDALVTEAFSVIVRSPSHAAQSEWPAPSADARVRAVEVLARAAGTAGMVGGQAIDLGAAGQVRGTAAASLNAGGLRDMHARKTGALIRSAAVMGAIAAGASPEVEAAIDEYAAELGLAFQIVDDILDVAGSTAALGKTAGKDAAADKTTYPGLFGLEASASLARAAIDRARAALESAGLDGGRLDELAEWSLARSH